MADKQLVPEPELLIAAKAFLEAWGDGADDERMAPLAIELGRVINSSEMIELADLIHDLDRYREIANAECNRPELAALSPHTVKAIIIDPICRKSGEE